MQQPTEHGDKNPKVSVCVITYNHARYVEQCLDSIVSQNVDFAFEIVVGVDLSDDGTLELVNRYALAYPERIRVLANARRIGGCQNYLNTHAAARGDYIAVLDGDDMMFPGKLALQASFLDAHADTGIVWHTMERSSSFSLLPTANTSEARQIIHLTLADQIAFGTLGAHSSKMYRSSLKYQPKMGDEFLDFDINVCQLQRTNGALIVGDPLGGYRANTGISSTDPGLIRGAYRDSLIKVSENLPQFRDELAANLIHEFLHAARRLWLGNFSLGNLLCQNIRISGIILYISTYSKRKNLVKGIFR